MQHPGAWYSSNQMLKAIGTLGENLYERELLRLIFVKYISSYFKNKRETNSLVYLKHTDFEKVMGRNSYMSSLKSLQQKGIIKYSAKMGKPGGHNASIITEAIVMAIKAKGISVDEILK
jgi:hypothetical protein